MSIPKLIAGNRWKACFEMLEIIKVMERCIYNISNFDAKMRKLSVKWFDRAGSKNSFKTIKKNSLKILKI